MVDTATPRIRRSRAALAVALAVLVVILLMEASAVSSPRWVSEVPQEPVAEAASLPDPSDALEEVASDEAADVAEVLRSLPGLDALVTEEARAFAAGASSVSAVALVAPDGSRIDAVVQRLDRSLDRSDIDLGGEAAFGATPQGYDLMVRDVGHTLQVIVIDAEGLLVNVIVERINRSAPASTSFMSQFTPETVGGWAMRLLEEARVRGWSE